MPSYADLLALARAIYHQHGASVVILGEDGFQVQISMASASAPPRAAAAPTDLPTAAGMPRGYFSAVELQVVQLVALLKLKGAAIGRRLGMVDNTAGCANTSLRGILKNLSDRGILDNDDDGYYLTDSARKVLAGWGVL